MYAKMLTIVGKSLEIVGKSLAILVISAVTIIVLVIVYAAVIYPVYLKSQAEIGMDKNQVLTNLEGKKYRLSDTLTMCESNAWYGDCESANNSKSVEFLILKIGIDTWLVVGFNSADKVSFVGLGDT